MESELLGSIWRWEPLPYKDQSGPTQQMREHRDGGPRKRGLKAEGTRDRWWRRGKEGWRSERVKESEGKWGMDGAADQRQPLVCLALPLKESQESRLGVLSSPGRAHTHTHGCTHNLRSNTLFLFLTNYFPRGARRWPARPTTNPPGAGVTLVCCWGRRCSDGQGALAFRSDLASGQACKLFRTQRRAICPRQRHNMDKHLTNYTQIQINHFNKNSHTKTQQFQHPQSFRTLQRYILINQKTLTLISIDRVLCQSFFSDQLFVLGLA